MASPPRGGGEPISSETVDTLLDSLETINKSNSGSSANGSNGSARPKPGTAAYRRLMAWERLREQTLTKVRDNRDQEAAADCTFQPNVPHAKHRADEPQAPIVQRLEERAKRHDETLLQMQKEKERKEAEECTFKPTLSVGSERYHRSNSRQTTPRGGGTADEAEEDRDSSSQQPHLFAYHQSQHTPRTVQEQRAHTESSKARHRDPIEDDVAECTFQPKIGPKSKLIYQTSRIEEGSTDVFNRLYQRSTPGRISASRRTRSSSADGRHHNTSLGSNGGAAPHQFQLPPVMLEEMKTLRTRFGYHHEPQDGMRCFLQNILMDEDEEDGDGRSVPQPIITAYSDEHSYVPPPPPQEHQGEEGGATPANTLSGVSPVSRGGGQNHLSSSRDQYSGGDQLQQNSTGNNEGEVMDFQEFLVRQDTMHDKRKEHHRKLVDQYTPSHKPSLCDESIRLASASGWESLSSRKRRDLESSRKKDLTNPDQQSRNISFQPKVSQPAELLPSRTPEEMWNDGERRQKRIDELRDQALKKKMAGSTFKPEINTNYSEVKSMLSGSDLTSYTEHLANKRKKEQEKAQHEKERKIKLEEEACTFKPKTNVTPSYIARMAQGISILRESSHIN